MIGQTEGDAKPSAAKAASASARFPVMTILGVTHTEKESAAKAILDACKTVTGKESVRIGTYLGFDISMSFDGFDRKYSLTLKGSVSYSIELGADAFGNITRINNALRLDMPERLKSSRTQLENLRKQMADAEAEVQRPFAHEAELAEKETRLAQINAELNIGDGGARDVSDATDIQPAAYAKGRPSVLDAVEFYDSGKQSRDSVKGKNGDITI